MHHTAKEANCYNEYVHHNTQYTIIQTYNLFSTVVSLDYNLFTLFFFLQNVVLEPNKVLYYCTIIIVYWALELPHLVTIWFWAHIHKTFLTSQYILRYATGHTVHCPLLLNITGFLLFAIYLTSLLFICAWFHIPHI